jgi:hypothetical protein
MLSMIIVASGCRCRLLGVLMYILPILQSWKKNRTSVAGIRSRVPNVCNLMRYRRPLDVNVECCHSTPLRNVSSLCGKASSFIAKSEQMLREVFNMAMDTRRYGACRRRFVFVATIEVQFSIVVGSRLEVSR